MTQLVSAHEAELLARHQPQRPWRQVFVALLAGEPTRDEVVRLIADRIRLAPRFRQVAGGPPISRWEPDRGFALRGHIKEYELAKADEFQPWLAGLLSTGFDPDHPWWEAWLVRGVNSRMRALVVVSHPALVDGYQNVHLLQELFDREPSPIPTTLAEEPAPPAAPTASRAGWDDILQAVGKRSLGALRELAGGLAPAMGGLLGGGESAAPAQHVAGAQIDLGAVGGVRRRFNCTSHDVLLSLVTAAIADWLRATGQPLTDPVALVPRAIQGPGATDSAVGCQVEPFWLALPVGITDPAERLDAIASLNRVGSDSGDTVPISDLTSLPGLAGATLHSLGAGTVSAGRPHQVYLGNAPGPAGRRYLGPYRLVDWYSFLGCTDHQQLTASISSLGSKATIAMVTTAPLAALAAVTGRELKALGGDRG